MKTQLRTYRRSLPFLILAGVLLILAGLTAGCSTDGSKSPTAGGAPISNDTSAEAKPSGDAEVNSDNGAIDLLDLDGNRFRLSEYRGKKVYMKFWASWCTVCLARLEEVEKLANDAGLDFEVVTVVSPGYGQELDLENFRKWFAKQEHNRFPVLIDEGGKLAKWYGVRGYPTSFFIDPEGAVKVFQGDLSGDMIHQVFASEMMNREPETEDD